MRRRRRAGEGAAGALDSMTSEIDAYEARCGGGEHVEENALVMVHNVVGTA